MLARSPETEAHDKVLDNNPDRIGIWKCWFLRKGENLKSRRKTSWRRVENQHQTQLTYDAGSRNRTRDTLVGDECSHYRANPAPYTRSRSRFSHTDRLSSVKKMFIVWQTRKIQFFYCNWFVLSDILLANGDESNSI